MVKKVTLLQAEIQESFSFQSKYVFTPGSAKMMVPYQTFVLHVELP